MNAPRERARSFLAYGLGISLAAHLILLPFVHLEKTAQAEERGPDVVDVIHAPTPPPTPPPTPTPKPTVPPTPPPRATTPQPQRRPRALMIHPPSQAARPRTGGGEPANRYAVGDPSGDPNAAGTPAPAVTGAPPTAAAGTPAPTPRPTPTPLTCARPNVAATTLRPVAPDTPPMAQQQGISGVVQVVVSLDAQSRVIGTRIQTSPSAVLNQAALAAARGSQFRTEVRNCEPVAADYVFSVDFTAQ